MWLTKNERELVCRFNATYFDMITKKICQVLDVVIIKLLLSFH